MVSLNSRAGPTPWFENVPQPTSESYSFPQFSISHTQDVTQHRTMPTTFEDVLEDTGRGDKDKVCARSALWVE
jgi:hypothetical protein